MAICSTLSFVIFEDKEYARQRPYKELVMTSTEISAVEVIHLKR